MPWLHLASACLRLQVTVSERTNLDQALAFIITVTLQIPSSWVPVTPPPPCARLQATLCNRNVTLAAPASMTQSATLGGGQASALTASSM
jgi:hypothetical protein